MSYGDDDYDYCPICGSALELESCWQCHGEGGWHDCGEDCCCCLVKDEITVDCDVCDGDGYYLQCMALPHTDAQMAAYRERAGTDVVPGPEPAP